MMSWQLPDGQFQCFSVRSLMLLLGLMLAAWIQPSRCVQDGDELYRTNPHAWQRATRQHVANYYAANKEQIHESGFKSLGPFMRHVGDTEPKLDLSPPMRGFNEAMEFQNHRMSAHRESEIRQYKDLYENHVLPPNVYAWLRGKFSSGRFDLGSTLGLKHKSGARLHVLQQQSPDRYTHAQHAYESSDVYKQDSKDIDSINAAIVAGRHLMLPLWRGSQRSSP